MRTFAMLFTYMTLRLEKLIKKNYIIINIIHRKMCGNQGRDQMCCIKGLLCWIIGTGSHHSPWYSPSLQHVGNAHIPGPDVKLPFLKAQHPTQDRARVDPDPHVNVKVQLLPHIPGVGG